MKQSGIYILAFCLFMVVALQAKQLQPRSADGRAFKKARSYYDSGEYEKARDILYRMARKYDDDGNFDYLLGMSFAKMDGITNRTYARKYLKMAVSLEKDSVRWRYDLGILLNRSEMKYMAYREFKEVIERDSGFLEAYLQIMDYSIDDFRRHGDYRRLGEGYKCALAGEKRFKRNAALHYKTALMAAICQSSNAARKIMGQIANPDTLQNEITMLNAYLEFEVREFSHSYRLFSMGILHLSEEESKGYFDISLLLSPRDKKRFDDLSESEQKIFADSVWESFDPDKTTPLNEKMVEHFARIYMAEILYSQPDRGRHAWETGRGQMYIRYGPPDFSHWSLPAFEDPHMNCKWIWVYNFGGRMVSFTFLNLFGGNSYALAPIGEGNDDSKAYALNTELPNVTRFAEEKDLINSIFSYFIYKGPDDESLLDLYVATPYNQFVYEPVRGHAVCDIEYRSVLIDADGDIISREVRPQQLVISPTLSRNPDFYNFTTITMPAPAESLKVSCAIEQKSAKRVNIYEMPLMIIDFKDDGFHLSSLILASKVGKKEKDSPFNRRDIKLIPNYTQTYRNTDTLIIYYEIYDLPTNIRNRTHYRLSYSIREIKPPQNVLGAIAGLFAGRQKTEITHTADRGDIRTDLYEPLKIDISPLRPGLYDFTLNVEDLIIGKNLTRKAQFSVVEPEKD